MVDLTSRSEAKCIPHLVSSNVKKLSLDPTMVLYIGIHRSYKQEPDLLKNRGYLERVPSQPLSSHFRY